MIVDWLEYKKVNSAIEELADNSDAVPIIKEALGYVIKAGGKRTRPVIVLLSGKLCSGNYKEVINLSLAVELIHVASLVHDDIIDKGMTRRNVETLHLKYGVPVAILLGDWLISKAVELVSVYKEDVIRDFSRLVMMMVKGEILDMDSCKKKTNKKDYFECIFAKTAAIFAYSAENGGKIVSDDLKATSRLYEYGKNLGIAYQLVDDLLEFLAIYDDKKSEFESRTLPVIYEEIYGFEESVVKILHLIQKHTSMSKKAIEYFEPCDSREKLSKMIDYLTGNLLRSYASRYKQFLKLIKNHYQLVFIRKGQT